MLFTEGVGEARGEEERGEEEANGDETEEKEREGEQEMQEEMMELPVVGTGSKHAAEEQQLLTLRWCPAAATTAMQIKTRQTCSHRHESRYWKLTKLKSRCGQGWLLLEPPRDNLFL